MNYRQLYAICEDLSAQIETGIPRTVPSSLDEVPLDHVSHWRDRLKNFFVYLVSEVAERGGAMSYHEAEKEYARLLAERHQQTSFLEEQHD